MTDKKTRGMTNRNAPARERGMVRLLAMAGVAACSLAGVSGAFGDPTGGQITGGSGTISQPDATTTRIDQASTKLAIDWSPPSAPPSLTSMPVPIE